MLMISNRLFAAMLAVVLLWAGFTASSSSATDVKKSQSDSGTEATPSAAETTDKQAVPAPRTIKEPEPGATASDAKKPAQAPMPVPMPMPAESSVAKVAAAARESVVVVTIQGRGGEEIGLGTGFVVSADGLIATNLHVIGEARPITVTFHDGRKFDVTEIHATERLMDLAVIRIDASNLKPLELGATEPLQPGEALVAIGNPLGFRHSVVTGVLSEKREQDGRPMLQVAIPVERGNSGGPLLDMQGRVQGIMTLKSLVTDNLGFAVVVDALKPLLEKPNPIPIARWTTIGALKERDWTPLFGARWRQRAGRILVDEAGSGFGGRSLCLSTLEVPEPPYEVAVTVRFTPEDGAAGLVFDADGKDRHYGFYPSNGDMRLTRFDGPSVYSWKVLSQTSHSAYRKGDWNTIKVRVEKDRTLCFMNDELVVESTDSGLKPGRVGLTKFRNTSAEFRDFRLAKELPSNQPSDEMTQRIAAAVQSLPVDRAPGGKIVEQLVPNGPATSGVLRKEAEELEQRAQRLKELAVAVHARRVQQQLVATMTPEEGEIDLLRAALLIALLDNEEVDVEAYIRDVEQMVAEVEASMPAGASESGRLSVLNQYLFEQAGFHGSRTNYYHRSNSYINEAIDDREGLPITLSVLYIEMARRLKLKVVGVGLPGHFVVRFEPTDGEGELIDVFENGKVMPRADAVDLIRTRLQPGTTPEEADALVEQLLTASTPQAIIVRMLSNLQGAADKERDSEAILRYLSTSIAIDPDHVESRARRIEIELRTNRLEDAIADIDWMLDRRPEGMNVGQVLQLRADLEAKLQQSKDRQ